MGGAKVSSPPPPPCPLTIKGGAFNTRDVAKCDCGSKLDNWIDKLLLAVIFAPLMLYVFLLDACGAFRNTLRGFLNTHSAGGVQRQTTRKRQGGHSSSFVFVFFINTYLQLVEVWSEKSSGANLAPDFLFSQHNPQILIFYL